MGDTTTREDDYVRDADCFQCHAVDGERMRLYFRMEDGGVWTWLRESILLAVVFTPEEARALLDGWKNLLDKANRGVLTAAEFEIRPYTPETGHRSTLAFGLRNGNMTYWRDGENRPRIELDRPTFNGLIEAWEDVCSQLQAGRSG